MRFGRAEGRQAWEDTFVAYYAAKGEVLRRTAFALCEDWHLGEDLTRTVFTNLYRVWRRIERHEVLDDAGDVAGASDQHGDAPETSTVDVRRTWCNRGGFSASGVLIRTFVVRLG
ncbi:MAG: hypothetical protein IRY85_10355 [Micromonosporaceae bacterium]|nr:hypothetical protein [Micromonosporaceae bacterium]